MSSSAPAAGIAGPVSVATSVICLLIMCFTSGQAEGFYISAVKDDTRYTIQSTAVPSRLESYQQDLRGIKGVMQKTNDEGQDALEKRHQQHSNHNVGLPPLPDFEHQLEKLKESHQSSSKQQQPAQQAAASIPNKEESPAVPILRRVEHFMSSLSMEDADPLGPIRRWPEEGGREIGADSPGKVTPLLPDLLESEADLFEDLMVQHRSHDVGTDHLMQLRPESQSLSVVAVTTRAPPMQVEKAQVLQMGTGDRHAVAGMQGDGVNEGNEGNNEDDEGDLEEIQEEDTDEHREEVTTQETEKAIISLEESLAGSLRRLAEIRRTQSFQQGSVGATDSAPSAKGTTLLSSKVSHPQPPLVPEVASHLPLEGISLSHGVLSQGAEGSLVRSGGGVTVLEVKRDSSEGRGISQQSTMRRAHMARKLMDSEDSKKDEDLLEIILRIAENPDEWKRVHHLLRQLDDDLTTYEKTIHRIEALATQIPTPSGLPLSEKERRREELSRSGLPGGLHGEAPLSITAQHLPSSSSEGPTFSHHKDWPKFAYHRVTSAPPSDPFLLLKQQQEHQQHHAREKPSPSPSALHRQKNAYIAVSVIMPPNARGGKQLASGAGQPLPSPPSLHTAPTMIAHHSEIPTTTEPPGENEAISLGDAGMVTEETLAEPVLGEEEVVDRFVGQESFKRHWKHHHDRMQDQLRALAAVDVKLRHQLHEKERMRHLLKEAGSHRNSNKSIKETAKHQRQHHPLKGDGFAMKTS